MLRYGCRISPIAIGVPACTMCVACGHCPACDLRAKGFEKWQAAKKS